MEKYFPLFIILLLFALIAACLFCGIWFRWVAPGRIRRAVMGRIGPRSIKGAVKTSPVYWAFMFILSAGCAGAAGAWCWRYLGLWLYNAVGGWQEKLAMMLSNTAWMMPFPSPDLDYAPFLPAGALLCVLLGIFIGALGGTWAGSWLASKRFLITKAMSLRK